MAFLLVIPALGHAGPSAQEYYQTGQELLKASKTQEALPYLVQAMAMDPSLPGGWRSLGYTQESLGQLEKALESYRNSFNRDPSDEYSKQRFAAIAPRVQAASIPGASTPASSAAGALPEEKPRLKFYPMMIYLVGHAAGYPIKNLSVSAFPEPQGSKQGKAVKAGDVDVSWDTNLGPEHVRDALLVVTRVCEQLQAGGEKVKAAHELEPDDNGFAYFIFMANRDEGQAEDWFNFSKGATGIALKGKGMEYQIPAGKLFLSGVTPAELMAFRELLFQTVKNLN